MLPNVGDEVKYHIDFMGGGVFIQKGRVRKIKEGFFSKKYLIELKSQTDSNTFQAHWVNEKNIIK